MFVKEIFLLLFSVFVLDGMSERTQLLRVDCSGAGHISKGGTDMMNMGLDLSMIKRALDAGMDIIHEHVECACPEITDDDLTRSFTPNLHMILRAMYGEESQPVSVCHPLMLHFDQIVGEFFEMIGFNSSWLPDTCNLDNWSANERCSMQVDLSSLIDESWISDDNKINIGLKQCENSIWPYITVYLEGPLSDYFMKPCDVSKSDTEECGQLKCERPVDDEEMWQYCDDTQWNPMTNTNECNSCPSGYTIEVRDTDERCEWDDDLQADVCREVDEIACKSDEPKYMDFNGMIQDILSELQIFQDTDSCADYPTQADAVNSVMTDTMSFILDKWVPDAVFSGSQMAFCGYPTDTTESLSRHRKTMTRVFSSLTSIFGDLSHLPTDQMLSGLAEKVKRRLLQGPAVDVEPVEPVDEEEEEEEELDLSDMFTAWDGDSDTWSVDKINGASNAELFKDSSSQMLNEFELLSMDCASSPQFTFLGGMVGGGLFRAYFLKYHQIMEFATNLASKLASCRTPLVNLEVDELRQRFLMFDPGFWMNLIDSKSVEPTGNSPSKMMYDQMAYSTEHKCEKYYYDTDESRGFKYSTCRDCCQSWDDWSGDCICIPRDDSVGFEGYCNLTKTYFEDEYTYNRLDEEEDRSCAAGNCNYDHWGGSGGFTECSDEDQPMMKILLPSTCESSSWVSEGQCSLVYRNIAQLFDDNLDISIAFELGRCSNTDVGSHFGYSASIKCVGSDCPSIEVSTKPCTSNEDCNEDEECLIIEVCDIFGDILWGTNCSDVFGDECDMEIRSMTFSNGTEIPDDTDVPEGEILTCPQNEDACTNTQSFRNNLIKAMLKVTNDANTDPAQHTGVCTPKFEKIEENAENWVDDGLWTTGENDITTVKGLSNWTATPITPPTPPPTTPPTPSPTTPPTTSPTTPPNTSPTTPPTVVGVTDAPTFAPQTVVRMVLGMTINGVLSDDDRAVLATIVEAVITELLNAMDVLSIDVQILIDANGTSAPVRRLLSSKVSIIIEVTAAAGVAEADGSSLSATMTSLSESVVADGTNSDFLTELNTGMSAQGLEVVVASISVDEGPTVESRTASPTPEDLASPTPEDWMSSAMPIFSFTFLISLLAVVSLL